MQNSDPDLETCNEISFWDPKQYSHTVKRYELASKLCTEFCALLQERSEIERSYGVNLKKWSNRWNSFRESGIEYGTCSNIIGGFCTEADQNAELHFNIANSLVNPIQVSLKAWQKERFHKSSIPTSIKEVKVLESEFEAAQKLWHKRHKNVNRSKKEHYQACKMVRSYQVQVQNAKNDPSGTPEQHMAKLDKTMFSSMQRMRASFALRKIEEKLVKAQRDESKSLSAYKDALELLDAENPRYVEEMTKVFEKWKNSERDRIEFFKSQADLVRKILDLSQKSELADIYSKMQATFNLVDSNADLKQWSQSHGVDMPMNFPQFEEYSPELSSIVTKKKSTIPNLNTGVTLTNISRISQPSMPGLPENCHPETRTIPESYRNPFDGDAVETTSFSVVSTDPVHIQDNGKVGVKVRALYDYEGVEDDELSFVTGDIFEKLEDEDEQGWCQGRKDGRIGLYPANYVEVV